jgi:hypothetical protein
MALLPHAPMRIPFIVPSLLAFVVLCCLLFLFGLNGRYLSYSGYLLVGYLVAMASVAIAPAGWFRMATSLSHSMVIGSLASAGLTSAFLEWWSAAFLLDMIAAYPATALAVASAIWLLEKGIRLSRFSEQLDRGR